MGAQRLAKLDEKPTAGTRGRWRCWGSRRTAPWRQYCSPTEPRARRSWYDLPFLQRPCVNTNSCRKGAPLNHTTQCFGTPPAVATQLPLTHTTPCFGTPSAVQRSSTHSHNTVFWDTTSCRNAAPLTPTQHRVLGHPQLSQRGSTHSHTTPCFGTPPAVAMQLHSHNTVF
jgi:hypothetical protein